MAKMESKLITDFVGEIAKNYDHLSKADFMALNTLEKTEAQLLNAFEKERPSVSQENL